MVRFSSKPIANSPSRFRTSTRKGLPLDALRGTADREGGCEGGLGLGGEELVCCGQ